MLRPPLRIFIAHRNGSNEFELAIEAIKVCKDRGFRIQAVFVNDNSFPFSENASGRVFSELDRADVGLVLLSRDERISSTEEGNVPPLAVMFEWGYLSSVMGGSRDNSIQLLLSTGVLAGEFRPEVKVAVMPSNLDEFVTWLHRYLADVKSLLPSGDLFFGKHGHVTLLEGDVGTPSMSETDLATFFADEMKLIANKHEILVFIYERIFFDVYFEDKEFWRSRIRLLQAQFSQQDETATYLPLLESLNCILHYTSGPWRAKKQKKDITNEDKEGLFDAYSKLKRLHRELPYAEINPIFSMVINNYLGLFESRDEIRDRVGENSTRLSFDHFVDAMKISKKYEVGPVKIWEGFISTNVANLLSNAKYPDQIPEYRAHFNSALSDAREARRKWLDPGMLLPHFLRDIFQTEYFSALQSLSSLYDGNGGVYKEDFSNEFNAWKGSPKAARFIRAKKLFDHERQTGSASWPTIRSTLKKWLERVALVVLRS